jgi:hypothetical protein
MGPDMADCAMAAGERSVIPAAIVSVLISDLIKKVFEA